VSSPSPGTVRDAAAKRGVAYRCLNTECSQVSARCQKDIFKARAYRCPSDEWVRSMVLADPDPDKILINIGCNKGQDSIAWLQFFDQKGQYNLKNWSRSLPRKDACSGKKQPPTGPPPISSSKGPTAVCVEAAPRNFKFLVSRQRSLGYGPGEAGSGRGSLHVIHAAATSRARPGEMVEFPDAPAGEERAGLNYHSDWKMVKVPKETVDGIAERLRLPKVDALLIDTEGADPAVLAGAKRTLQTVRYLVFEVHRDLPGSDWSKKSLFSVADSLDTQGFDCWWAANDGSVASVTQCYEPRFEEIGWSNVVCAKRGDVWWKILEALDPNAK